VTSSSATKASGSHTSVTEMALPARAARFDLDVGPALRAAILGVGLLVGAAALLGVFGLVLTRTETGFTWAGYAQQIVSGLAQGAIYASLALALVLIYRATDVLNFAQGEMATFTTFIAWSLMNHMSYWPAFALTLVIAFVGGAAVERIIIRPVEHRPDIVIVIVTIGLLIALNGLSGWIWNPEIKAFDTPFPTGTTEIGGVVISYQDLGVLGVCLTTVVLLWVFFRFTTLGLIMRAVANSQDASRLLGVRVGWMLALGWGLAAVLGAVAGMMAAPTLFLDPNLMLVVLIYSFAAAVLGGIDSPVGAVVGGLILGVLINILGTYVDFIGGELRLPAALAVLVIVLLIRPQGLFGHKVVRRV
jgi:branched-chain amino acid transport system permease protein